MNQVNKEAITEYLIDTYLNLYTEFSKSSAQINEGYVCSNIVKALIHIKESLEARDTLLKQEREKEKSQAWVDYIRERSGDRIKREARLQVLEELKEKAICEMFEDGGEEFVVGIKDIDELIQRETERC